MISQILIACSPGCAATGNRHNSLVGRSALVESVPEQAESLSRPFRLASAPAGPVRLRIRHYESDETIQVPFDLRMGIGL